MQAQKKELFRKRHQQRRNTSKDY